MVTYLKSDLTKLIKYKDISVTTTSTQYDGWYVATFDTGLSNPNKIINVSVIGSDNNHAAFVGYYHTTTGQGRVNCVAANTTVYLRVWYINI